ncbi:hypothetical protein B0H19DRAFT_192058 [Mycena capillaripes]|nr:hypothetical protein B0H19DRAFT_192058 [Mycena capillaripes]
MGRSRPAQRASRTPSLALTTRTSLPLPCVWADDDDPSPLTSRKSDIENERLPPDLVDPTSEEGKALMSSDGGSGSASSSGASSPMPSTPIDIDAEPAPAFSPAPEQPDKPLTLDTAVSPAGSGSLSPVSPFRRGHARQASLGTTMTSPSTRRRGLEETVSLIQGVWDGKAPPVPGPGGHAEESIAEEGAAGEAPVAEAAA